jgi:hypothetical protein
MNTNDFNCHNLKFNKQFNFGVDSVFRQNSQPDYSPNPPPVVQEFGLSDGTPFLLSDGSDFLLS